LLSRLAFALRQAEFMAAIAGQGSREQVFAASQAVDQTIPSPTSNT
jgi:hypothetical protein